MTALEVRDEAEALLRQLSEEQLMEVASSMSLTLKDGKKNKLEALRNLITRYLRSEDVEDLQDEGLDVYQKLKDQLVGMVKPNTVSTKIENVSEAGSGGSQRSKLELLLKLQEELEAEENTPLAKLLKKDLVGESKLLDQLLNLKSEDVNVRETKQTSVETSRDSNSSSGENWSKVDVTRFKKDFKIDGGILGGTKNGLDLCSQNF